MPPIEADEKKRIVEARQIQTLCHFTWADNLPSIIRRGLVPREVSAALPKGESYFLDGLRLDGHTDGTCITITFPNYRMFFKYRCDHPYPDKWCVLLLSPEILWEKDCAFYFKNAADHDHRNRRLDVQRRAKALEDMFYPGLVQNGQPVPNSERDQILAPNETTDPQAEVLVFEPIEVSHIRSICFNTEQGLIEARNALRRLQGVPQLVHDEQWFAPRRDWQRWQREEN